jgi:pyridoxine 5-phosphate synthase
MLLGVNIDHVATLRQARGTSYPDPLSAALQAVEAGADSITVHLREDRRHIQDSDVWLLQEQLSTRLNLEMAVTDEMLRIACEIRPTDCCLVPEKRAELTTEGGLDVATNITAIKQACDVLRDTGIRVSLFIDPDPSQVGAALEAGAEAIELHTGTYADAPEGNTRDAELRRLATAATFAHESGLTVHAGHGLQLDNVHAVAAIPEIVELNIGHSIIANSIATGLTQAVRDMKQAMLGADRS